ncbi:hypothetical protein CWATWH0005_5757 [Crocosphaera watsonii WH 0005]|uniref:Uncharacterized protein n=1 Tax=Crocosphaera watsonii WH 0005 TaxID=423472 RepID=T2IU86_CROWT|nr:hypothetical protein CWATWH0005_5757 [Crocosphaera watsonii WH 0005]
MTSSEQGYLLYLTKMIIGNHLWYLRDLIIKSKIGLARL